MASVSIFVDGLAEDDFGSGHFGLLCCARADGSPIACFTVDLPYADNAAQKAAAIEAKAISVLASVGVTVGGGDKKTLFGGPSN